MEDKTNRAVLTVDETAEALGISRNSAYKAVSEGQIPSIRVGKRILVLRKPLTKMLEDPDD
jgi:excisionase family DNA binding protein